MTTRENDIRVSANATDPCPADIKGVSPDACSVITNASHADITNRIYAVPPTYTVADDTLPSGLQSKLDSCNIDGTCNFVSYDFETDAGTTSSSLPYVINTRTTTTENSSVLVKKRQVQVSSISGDGRNVTVTTTVAHDFLIGGTVSLSIPPYIGEFVINSVPTSTTFTYESSQPCPSGSRVYNRSCVTIDVYNKCAPGTTWARLTDFTYYGFCDSPSVVRQCPLFNNSTSCPSGTVFAFGFPSINCPTSSGVNYIGRPCMTQPFPYATCSKPEVPNSRIRVPAPPNESPASAAFSIKNPTPDKCKDVLITPITTNVVINSDSIVKYTPPKPTELTTPNGYYFDTSSIIGTQIGATITNATETSCSQQCDNNGSCIGFNYSSIGNTCQMFSSITSNVVSYDVSFIKNTKVTTTLPSVSSTQWCPLGDLGAEPIYYDVYPKDKWYNYTPKPRCLAYACVVVDPNAVSAALDASNLCRVTCKSGYQRDATGNCVSCNTIASTGDPGTIPTYSTSTGSCVISGCTSTDPNATGATLDSTGICRNTCRYQKNASGTCIPCPVTQGDPGTTPIYSTGCTVSGCNTTHPNAYGATLDSSGVCRNMCNQGFQKDAAGTCVACVETAGDPGTTPVYGNPGSCTPTSCTTNDPNATTAIGQSATLDSTGACRNNCRYGYTRNSSGICVVCPNQNINGDPGTSVSQNPSWVSSGGSCAFLCIVTLTGNLTSASVAGATQDVAGNCRVKCKKGYKRTATGTCEVCPNSLPTGNDTGTSAYYKGFTGDVYSDDINNQSCVIQCITTDSNASIANLDTTGICRNTCNSGYQRSSTGACTACTGVNGWGDAGTSVISFSSGCVVSGCATTDPNAFGAGYTTFYTSNGDCVNYCKTGFQRDFTNNQAGKCTACPTLNNTGGDPGTTLLYTASGTCSAIGCTTTDPNASSAGNSSGVCRNVCKAGYTRNSSGTCVTCISLNDTGASPTSYSSGCIASACTTTDVNASGASPDASGVCRNTCKAGYTRDSTGKCTTCNPPRDSGTNVTTYSSGCIASACTTADVNASGASPDASGVCRNTCKSGYQKNSSGACVTCTNTGDSGTTPTSYLSGCFVSTCTTTDTNASSASPDTSGVCRNVCKPGYRNSSGSCVSCPKTRLVLIQKDNTTGFNQLSFYVQYIGTTAIVGRIIYYSGAYWKIFSATGITFVTSWVSTYGLSSTSGTLCTVVPIDIYGNEVFTNPILDPYFASQSNFGGYSFFPNTDVPYCGFDYSNCPKGDPYSTVTYQAGSCNIIQCITTDVNVASASSDGSACRNTCKKNYEKNIGGMCVPKQCQTSDPNSPGAELVSGSCRTMCNISYSLNNSGVCEACPVEYVIRITKSSIYPDATDGCYMLISSDKTVTVGMVVHYSNTRFVIVNVVTADVSYLINMGTVPNRPGYGVDVYAIDSYGTKIANPAANIWTSSNGGNVYKNINLCNSI